MALSVSKTTVLVIDFAKDSPGTTSQIGALLAGRFSDFLKSSAHNFEILDGNILAGNLRENWTTLEDLRSENVCLTVARSLGAVGIVRGVMSESPGGDLTLSVTGIGFGPRWSSRVKFAVTNEMHQFLLEPEPSYSRVLSTIHDEPDVVRLGDDDMPGVSRPSCVACPNPQFTTFFDQVADGQEHLQESVLLSVIVTREGKVTSIYVLRGAPFGLTQAAIDAVTKWQLRPALRNNEPIAVRTTIETTFRTF